MILEELKQEILNKEFTLLELDNKVLEISLQNEDEVDEAIKYNKENGNDFVIRGTSNIVSTNCLTKFFRYGNKYNMYIDLNDRLCLKSIN